MQVLAVLTKLVLLQLRPHSASAAAGATYAASVRQLVSELGVLWVKLGQTLSVRPDLIGTKLAAALAGLQVRLGAWLAGVMSSCFDSQTAASNYSIGVAAARARLISLLHKTVHTA